MPGAGGTPLFLAVKAQGVMARASCSGYTMFVCKEMGCLCLYKSILMDYTFVPFSSCLDHFIPQKEIKIQSTVGLCYE